MNPRTRSSGNGLIAITLVVGLLLTLMPLPQWLAVARPEWLLLVLIYWNMAIPGRIGVGIAWVVGLFQDVAVGALLGQHALAFALVAYLVMRLHQRLRLYTIWQQAVAVLVLVALNLLILSWIRGVVGEPAVSLWFWAPAVTSMLIWPLMFVLLRALRRRYRIA
ncbi:MAG: rod shape-determining protein MreD [Pseudomonadota bacterium]